jgi:hypothetical protein
MVSFKLFLNGFMIAFKELFFYFDSKLFYFKSPFLRVSGKLSLN